MSEIKKISFCLVGNSAVGKTSIVNRFVNPDDPFNPETLPTIGLNHYSKTVQMKKGKPIKVQIFDPCGQEQFHSLTKNFYQNAAGVILVYSINDRSAFEKILSWIQEVKDYAQEEAKMILIANKKDLPNAPGKGQEKSEFPMYRVVTEKEGRDVAQKFEISFFEVSAKTGEGIEECFMDLIEKTYDAKVQMGIELKKHKKKKKKKC